MEETLDYLKSQCRSAKGCINSYFKVKDIELLIDEIEKQNVLINNILNMKDGFQELINQGDNVDSRDIIYDLNFLLGRYK